MPFVDVQMCAEGFDVGDEVVGRVVVEGGWGRGFAAAALVEEDDAVDCWVEEGGVGGGGFDSGTAVEEECWFSI